MSTSVDARIVYWALDMGFQLLVLVKAHPAIGFLSTGIVPGLPRGFKFLVYLGRPDEPFAHRGLGTIHHSPPVAGIVDIEDASVELLSGDGSTAVSIVMCSQGSDGNELSIGATLEWTPNGKGDMDRGIPVLSKVGFAAVRVIWVASGTIWTGAKEVLWCIAPMLLKPFVASQVFLALRLRAIAMLVNSMVSELRKEVAAYGAVSVHLDFVLLQPLVAVTIYLARFAVSMLIDPMLLELLESAQVSATLGSRTKPMNLDFVLLQLHVGSEIRAAFGKDAEPMLVDIVLPQAWSISEVFLAEIAIPVLAYPMLVELLKGTHEPPALRVDT